MIRPRIGPSSAARDLIAFAAQKATNKVICSQSPNEYEDLDKELEDLNARASTDGGIRDLFEPDDKNQGTPLEDLNQAPPIDNDVPPLQLQLDAQDEPASQIMSQMPAKKETMAPVIQIKRRASLHIPSTILPPPRSAFDPAKEADRPSDQPPSSLELPAPSLKPALVKTKQMEPSKNPLVNPPSSSQPLEVDPVTDAQAQELKAKAARKPPVATAFSLFSKSKRSSIKASLPKDDQSSIKSVNAALKASWEDASYEVKRAFEVIAAQENGEEEGAAADGPREVRLEQRGEAAEEPRKSEKREKKSRSHKRKKSRDVTLADAAGQEGEEGAIGVEGGRDDQNEEEGRKSSKRQKQRSSSRRGSNKRSKRDSSAIEDDGEGGGEEAAEEEEGAWWKWKGGGAQADAILGKSRDSASFIVSGYPQAIAQGEGEAEGEVPMVPRGLTSGLVDARPVKMQRLTGPDPSLPVSLSLVDEYEAFEARLLRARRPRPLGLPKPQTPLSRQARFQADVKGRMDDKGGLDLDDLPPGSSLEMCALLGWLREPGMPLCPSTQGLRGVADRMVRVPCMALSMVVQRIVELERAKVAPL